MIFIGLDLTKPDSKHLTHIQANFVMGSKVNKSLIHNTIDFTSFFILNVMSKRTLSPGRPQHIFNQEKSQQML